jgi:MutS domain V/MutS domain III
VPHSALHEYQTRLTARRATRDALDAADARYANGRLATVGFAVLIGILAWNSVLSFWWLTVLIVVFAWLMRRHDRVLRARDGAARAMALYERGLARLEDRWVGTGEAGDRFRDDRHVYANDLDLFGHGSLFQLLSVARTRTGEETLARWLTAPADAPEIRARQDAVAELAPALDLRERLAMAGADVRTSVQTDRLLEWAEMPMQPAQALNAFTWLFTAATLGGITFLAITSTWLPLGIVLLLQAVVFHRLKDQINAIVSARDPESTADFVADALTHRAHDLDVVADLLKTLEREPFTCPRLTALRDKLNVEGVGASRIIRQLHRLAVLHDSERNTIIFPLALFLIGKLEAALILGSLLQLVRPHVALAVDRWRKRHGTQVRAWLETVAELEALMSLASYKYERDSDPFPEIITSAVGSGAPAVLDGLQLGHPLLPSATMVRNDVHLAGTTQLLVVSGSNMSGKSTLLRTVGINAVLALAGAPVRAASLRLTPLAIGATLRIQDSLLEGRSRFYAEITRIREIADLAAGPIPLLFLLDELFHGTNSQDRLVGASGVLRSLLDRGAVGLITTHDLALTAVADQLSPRAVNVHFQDWFEGNEIRFDYLMKPGPVTRSNAIALMRAVGLDVGGDGLNGSKVQGFRGS